MSDETPKETGSEDSPNLPGDKKAKKKTSKTASFFLKGLAISLPPVLTLVIMLWIFGLVYSYMLRPVAGAVEWTWSQFISDIRPSAGLVPPEHHPRLPHVGKDYMVTLELQQRIDTHWEKMTPAQKAEQQVPRHIIQKTTGEYPGVFVQFRKEAVPYSDYAEVARSYPSERPQTARQVYMSLVTQRYFGGLFSLIVVAVIVTMILLYFLGRFVTARVGSWVIKKTEATLFGRLPVVSNVYSSVKQVTDFLFAERTVSYNRVIAIEYPRKGLWSIGFVTGDSMLDISAHTGEPMLAVLMPTSPMPMTGFTISIPRSQVVDLNLTIDQAFQFCLSCGVLVPPQQKVTPELLQQEILKRLSGAMPSHTVIEGGPVQSAPAQAAADQPPAEEQIIEAEKPE